MKRGPLAARIYRVLLRLFPFDFQREFGAEMERVFHQEYRDAAKGGVAKTRTLWWITIRGF